MKRKITYCCLLILSFYCLLGQESLDIELRLLDAKELPKKVKLKSKVTNEEEAIFEFQQLLVQLRKQSYITASVDTLYCDSTSCIGEVFLGENYPITSISNGNIEAGYWSKLKLDKSKNEVEISELEKLEKRLLIEYENNGFPYAQVWLDSFSMEGQQVGAFLYSDKKDAIILDSIIVHGDTKTRSKFVERYLGLKSGEVFNQKKLNRISKKLKQLSYLSESKPAELYFEPGKVKLHVFLQQQKSNQFNLIIGILPNDQLPDKKVTVTGDGRLHLLNSFGVGEEIFAEFKQIKPRTQNLDLNFSYPYLLNSPIGVFGAFNLYKNDSLFIDINSEIGVLYQFGGFNQLKLFYNNQTSNVLNVDSNTIKASGQLPSTLDLRNNKYGASINLQQLDYVLNPRKGYQLNLKGLVGLNKLKVNQSLASLVAFDGLPLQYQYDSLDVKKVNYSIGLHYSHFLPIKKRSTFLLRNTSQFYIAKNVLNNEKFRVGGYKLLRGFDEEAIFTPFYSIFTLEYRFLLSKNSYISLFSDAAIVEDERFGAGNIDVPFGFGAGLALETKGGIFSLSYALGKNLDNNIEFKNGKIHFGFISIF